jgi:hypothetical protein
MAVQNGSFQPERHLLVGFKSRSSAGRESLLPLMPSSRYSWTISKPRCAAVFVKVLAVLFSLFAEFHRLLDDLSLRGFPVDDAL